VVDNYVVWVARGVNFDNPLDFQFLTCVRLGFLDSVAKVIASFFELELVLKGLARFALGALLVFVCCSRLGFLFLFV